MSTVLNLVDLVRMVGKERELCLVVVFLVTLDSICSHDPLLSKHNHIPLGVFALCIVGYLYDGLLVPTDDLYSWHFGAPCWLALTCPRQLPLAWPIDTERLVSVVHHRSQVPISIQSSHSMSWSPLWPCRCPHIEHHYSVLHSSCPSLSCETYIHWYRTRAMRLFGRMERMQASLH